MSAILAVFLGLDWWVILLAYPLIGILWAVAYLPRSIRRQAEQYRAWRTMQFRGLSAEAAFQAFLDPAPHGVRVKGTDPEYFLSHAREYSLSQIGLLFKQNALFWPITFPYLVLTDVMLSFWRWVGRKLRVIWLKVFHPIYQACYKVVTRIYRAIISWANREALADMEKLQNAQRMEGAK